MAVLEMKDGVLTCRGKTRKTRPWLSEPSGLATAGRLRRSVLLRGAWGKRCTYVHSRCCIGVVCGNGEGLCFKEGRSCDGLGACAL
jgi:hypothetical protein